MPQEPFDVRAFAPRDWHLAATLTERARRPGAGGAAVVDEGRAARRDARWRAQEAFADDAMFERRLEADGLTREQFVEILGDASGPVEPAAPGWTQAFARSFAGARSGEPTPGVEQGLWPLIAPLAREALGRACAIARASADPWGPIDPERLESLLDAALPRARLRTIAARTVVLELNVARLRGDVTGATPEERYSNFLGLLADPDHASRLLGSYPVLARQIVEALDAWVTCQTEFLARLRGDWEAVRAQFFPDAAPGALVEISPPQGDLHRGGRAVLMAHFAGGARLVYKPRSLAGEAHFQSLLRWLNARLDGLSLAAPDVLDRGAYGWCAFAVHAPCASEDEVRAFYTRLGGLAAVLTVLDATDMHSENLVAAGAHPLLVDLECLFQPRAYVHLGTDGAPLPAADEFYTVLRTGILPTRTWLEGGQAGVDTSALGAVNGQALPDPSLTLQNAGTDRAHFVSSQATMEGPARHVPALAAGNAVAPAGPEGYDEELIAGFAAVYRCVLAHREELCAADGPLEAFAGDEIRVLVRDTRTYGLLLDDGFHPDYLRDALERDRLFDRLWTEVARRPYLAPLVPSEHADLHDRDIPMFTTRPDSHDLWDSRGRCIPGLFRCSSLEMVRRQVGRLGEVDLARQTWAMRAALDTLRMNRGEGSPPVAGPVSSAPGEALAPGALLSLARTIGDHLDTLAMRGESMACWAGVLARRGVWAADIVDHSLHSGTGGIALFLAALARLTGETRFETLAMQAAEAVCIVAAKRCREGVGPNNNPGLDYGWGGVFYVLATLGAQWPALAPRYGALLSDLLPVALADVARHPVADVAQGASGCVLGLLAAWEVSADGRFHDAAILCGERVLELGFGGGAGGLARGSAGIAYALAALARATSDARFAVAAGRALDHGRACATADAGPGWATGVAGTTLVSLAMVRGSPEDRLPPDLVTEITGALARIAAAPVGKDHSVSEGDLGVLELLLQVRAHGPLGELAVAAGMALDAHLARLAAEGLAGGWRCGLPGGRETPGLMTGLAGIGYQLLRMAAPDRVPPLVLSAAL